ncbi:DUF488 family protein [Chloroflexota bacterium]
MPAETVFTIGHSTHKYEYFVSLLNKYGINCLIDVRSSPYSRMAPQFNKDVLSTALSHHDIMYAHFEEEFGARHTRPSLLDENGKVDFEKVRATEKFKEGVQRLKKALELGYKIVLMCSEGDPFDCHRFSMISYQLVKEGWPVKHILKDGEAIENSALENQLLEKYQKKLPQSTLFETVTREMQIEAAYKLRSKNISFSALKALSEEDMD